MSKAKTMFLTVPVFVAAMGVSPAIFAADPDQVTDDTTISEQVRAAVIADPALQLTLVHVDTSDGTVQLSGVVRTKDQENEVVKIANQTGGVKSVENNLEIRSY